MAKKAAKSSAGGAIPHTESLFTQTAVAFGHGTGGLHVTPEAARELRRQWLAQLRRNRARWETEVGQALEFARIAGRLAAHASLARGVGVIDAADVVVAIERLSQPPLDGSRYVGILRGCPFC